ncbi:hypothetical protein Salat_1892300 [Sesamum alatum]|uniref:Uncharacterized protein n=1 Tax=Sesamum alatum TaxID=300844 RepID=A0AAE1Y416_9LAMI|nr:hypothetical protein Salat_1892300 [Sesamum alatum]
MSVFSLPFTKTFEIPLLFCSQIRRATPNLLKNLSDYMITRHLGSPKAPIFFIFTGYIPPNGTKESKDEWSLYFPSTTQRSTRGSPTTTGIGVLGCTDRNMYEGLRSRTITNTRYIDNEVLDILGISDDVEYLFARL